MAMSCGDPQQLQPLHSSGEYVTIMVETLTAPWSTLWHLYWQVEPYMPPDPPAGAHHRYVFLLYKQPGRVNAKPPSKRQGFQVGTGL